MRARARQPSLAARHHYNRTAMAAGPLRPVAVEDQPVRYRRVPSLAERVVLTLLVLLNAATATVFIGWLLLPHPVPGFAGDLDRAALQIARFGFARVVGVQVIRLVQNFAVSMYAFNAKDAIAVDPPTGWRIAVLSTVVPSKERLDIVERTLRKMQQIAYCG